MRQNLLAIHSENILPIIKKWLYSDKDIFIRELVSNATDALNKVKILGKTDDLKISITLDKAAKTITISDTGIGMTEEEVEKYIAQIAFSGAEEFVAKYKKESEKDPIIGHFGLGFYSAYMVASKVEIQTLSHLENASPVFWSCDGTSSYSIGEGNRKVRGTDILLYIDESSLDILEEAKLKELLKKYASFMPFPIDLNGTPIQNGSPLWMKAPSECTDQEYIEFYHKLFPMDPDPLFWIHLNVDYPFHLQGILYFPQTERRFAQNESTISLYCNRVFVSDNCRDILPDYLTTLKGALDSPDIPLNVSRSYLQIDQNVKQLSAHISKKVSDKLSLFYKNDREKYIASYPDLEAIVKLGILQDEKFYERSKDFLIWKTSEEGWTNVAEYLERASEKKVYYAASDRMGPLLSLYREKKIEILKTSSPLDTAVIEFLERKLGTPFQRIDGALNDKLLDPSRDKTLLDANGKTESSKIADLIRRALDQKELTVEAKSLASDALPALLILDENERRFRDYMALVQGKSIPKHLGKKTFVVNTNNKLVLAIAKISEKNPDLATDLSKSLYDLSLLSQREMDPSDLEKLVETQTHILEKLSSLLA